MTRPGTEEQMAMRTGGFWMLVVSAALLSTDVFAADQSGTGSTQQSSTTAQSSTSGKNSPAAKITVVSSVAVPLATTGMTATTGATGTATSSPPTVTPPAQLPPPHPTAQKPASRKRTSATSAKAPAPRRVTATPKSAPSQPAEHKPASTNPSPVSATESTITVEGSITAVDLKTAPPTLQMTLSFGPVLTLTADPVTTAVVNGDHPGKLEDVHVHDGVKVVYTPKDGSRLVKSIEIKQAPSPASGSSAGPSAIGVPKKSD